MNTLNKTTILLASFLFLGCGPGDITLDGGESETGTEYTGLGLPESLEDFCVNEVQCFSRFEGDIVSPFLPDCTFKNFDQSSLVPLSELKIDVEGCEDEITTKNTTLCLEGSEGVCWTLDSGKWFQVTPSCVYDNLSLVEPWGEYADLCEEIPEWEQPSYLEDAFCREDATQCLGVVGGLALDLLPVCVLENVQVMQTVEEYCEIANP